MKVIFTLILSLFITLAFQVNAEKVTFMHPDALGSPVAATDEGGNVIWTEHYKPYGGKVEDDSAANTNSIGFTGHEFDSKTGLTYMQARYYDPVIGRFYSNDPVDAATFINQGNVQGFNRYAYANNNPYKYTDPDGRAPFLIPLVIFLLKEGAAEVASQATGGATDFLSTRKMATKGAKKIYMTYTKTNKKTGEVYSGRTSGTGNPMDILKKRDGNHHKNKDGFGPAEPDKVSGNKDAIRGREQQLIEGNGGAKSQGGTSGNAINGISDKNKNKQKYTEAAKKEFN